VEVEWSSDVGAADWIVARLHPFARDVGSFVPDGFDAYARIPHPASRTENGRPVKVRWSDLARTRGASLEATTRFEDITTPDVEPPLTGTLEADELDALVELLATATSTPESCSFGVWDGYGWMQGPPAIAELRARSGAQRRQPLPELGVPGAPADARVQVPERSLALYRGPIEAAAALCGPPASQSPNLWWPEDHAWCVASEIDHHSTYLGGSQDLVDRVLRDERVEALRVRLSDAVTD
jgi:hypothetical protein